MPLVEVPLPALDTRLPTAIEEFCCESMHRSDYLLEVHDGKLLEGFVPSDPRVVYPVLAHLAESRILPGRLFCEWGSGVGTITCLAAMLDFAAHGIEIEEELVEAARQLAADHELAAEFYCGSFLPDSYTNELEFADLTWLDTEAPAVYDDLELEIDDFDVIFAYPWPGERIAIDRVFLYAARDGALLVTYDSSAQVTVRRKVPKGKRR